ncbi:MAG: DHA2 family efflux MFS transporter permease subunit [Syntrophobacteraceae bacterium]
MEVEKSLAAVHPPREAPGYWGIAGSVAFAAFMTKLDTYIVNITLPTIARYFNVGTSEASHTIIAYLVVGTSTLLFFGRLGDKVGLRKIFLWGYGLFTVGSLLCAASCSIIMLVGSRLIQGLGGAMLISSGYAIIAKFIPANKTGWAFGILSTSAMLGVIIGAPLGGFINGYLSWHWIFLINIPVGIMAIIAALRALPGGSEAASPDSGLNQGNDVPGTLLSFLGLSALLYALTTGQEWGWTSPVTGGLLFLSFLVIVAFLIWEKCCICPLIDFALFRNSRFACATMAAFFGYMLMGGNAFLMPFYLELAKGLNTVSVGLLLLVNSVASLVLGLIAGRLSDRISPSFLTTVAMASAALSSYFFSGCLKFPGLVPVVVFLAWFGVSYGVFVSPNNNQAMSALPENESGMGSGVFNTVNTLGLAFGVTLLELILSQAVPHGGASLETHLNLGKISAGDFLGGFEKAYLFGAIMCMAALAWSAIVMFSDIRRRRMSRHA